MRITTKYPRSIREGHDKLFKSGKYNAKLGDKITKGVWKGMNIYSLTLVERDTCPKTCYHWDDCYGNHMPFAHRFKAGKALEKAIPKELAKLATKHPNGFVIRLHVLGDFYSPEYVKLWGLMLVQFPMMRLYGYTARMPGDPIHKEVWLLGIRFSERVKIRFSHAKSYSDLEPFTMYSGPASSEFEGFLCPEQSKKVGSCAQCAACWQTNKSVKFITH